MTRAPAAATRTRIALPDAFDFDWLRRFLALRCVSSLEAWTAEAYVRSIWVDGASGDGTVMPSDGMAVTLTIRHRVPRGRPTDSTGHATGRHAGARQSRAGVRVSDARGARPAVRAQASLDVTCTSALPAATVRALVTRMFDLDADLDAFAARVRRDTVIGPLVRRRPYVRLPRIPDAFEGLVRAMLGQQVTVRAASTMTDRFVRRFGTPLPESHPNGVHGARLPRLKASSMRVETASTGIGATPLAAVASPSANGLFAFPRPDVIAGIGAEGLRTIGLTRAKAAAIARLAATIADGRLVCAHLAALPPDEAHAALLAVPGIGPWTASYVRMRVLGDRDAFPAADLGVIKALDALGVARADHAAVAERWRPWRGYATLHLWESLGSHSP